MTRAIRFSLCVLAAASLWLSGCEADDETVISQIEAVSPDAAVEAALADPDPYVRAELAYLLGHVPHRAALDTLMADENALVAVVAAGSAARLDPGSNAAKTTLEQLVGEGVAEGVAVVDAARRLRGDLRLQILGFALAPKRDPTVRRAAARQMVRLVDNAGDVEIARDVERRALSYATDPDPLVAGVILGKLANISRLVGEVEPLRKALRTTALSSEPYDRRARAVSILTLSRDPDLAAIAHPIVREVAPAGEVEAATEEEKHKRRLYELAVIALAQSGEKTHIAQADALVRRIGDPDLQRAAARALVQVDDSDARIALGQALENPDPGVRQAALDAIRDAGARVGKIRIPESVLVAPSDEVRVTAMKLLWSKDRTRYERLVVQKLGVEGVRDEFVHTLALWVRELEDAGLTDAASFEFLAPAREPLLEMKSNLTRDKVAALGHLYTVLPHLVDRGTLYDELASLPLHGQYALLTHALRTRYSPSEATTNFALESPYVIVRVLGALLSR